MPIVFDLLDNRTIKCSFPFSKETIAAIKQNTIGYRWSKSDKYWSMPIDNFYTIQKKFPNAIITDVLQERVLSYGKRNALKPISEISLKLFPREYQKNGAIFLASTGRALLADDVGAGKSIQFIIASMLLPDIRKVLILCPATLKYNWKAEIEKWVDTTITIVHDDKLGRKALWDNDSFYTIANYDLLLADTKDILKQKYDLVCCDEASYLKSYSAKRTKIAAKLDSKYLFLLTASPMENNYLELHSLLSLINPLVAGSKERFVKEHCRIGIFRNIVGYKNINSFMSKVENLYLKRIKADVLKELPPILFYDKYLDMPMIQWREYVKKRKEFEIWLEEEENPTITNVLVQLLRLRQVCDHPLLLGIDAPSVKMDMLEDDMEKHGQKTIVFTFFTGMADIIVNDPRFAKYNPQMIAGKTKISERVEIINLFNRSPDMKMLVMTDAGARGLNIQGASLIIHFDSPWNPELKKQKDGRAHRFGQDQVVTSISYYANDSADIKIRNILQKKRNMSEVIRTVPLMELV